MSVAKMQLLQLVGPVADFDRIVMECVLNREFHPEDTADIVQTAGRLRKMDAKNPYEPLLGRIKELAERTELTLDYNDFSALAGGADEAERFFDAFAARLDALKGERDALAGDADEMHMIAANVAHLRGVGDDVDVSEFFKLEYVRFRFGRIPTESYEHFITFLTDSHDFYFFETGREPEYVYGAFFVPTAHMRRIDTLFASLRFERIFISGIAHGSPDHAESEIEAVEADDRRRVAEIDRELDELINEGHDEFLAWYSLVRYLSDAYNTRRFAVATEDTFFLFGWIPEELSREYTALLDGVDGLSYKIDDPSLVPDVTPPTKLRNARIFKRFEPFVAMYGLPAYGETDPTPLMGIFYTLIFGIMFGDVGQGLLVALIGMIMWRTRRNWLGRVLVYAGFAGALVGFGYGSVFGFENLLPFGFHVLESAENSTLALRYSIYLGIGVLTLVMLINMFNGFKSRDFEKMIFGQSGLAGIVLFYAVMLALLPMLGFLDVSVPGTVLMLMFVIPVVSIVLRHPLGKLMARKPDWKPESIGAFLVENIFELIEIFLAYVTNAVSFVRIGIFIISHSAMMGIVFMLAGGHENPNMVVVIIGNLFVMGLEGLLVGIQVLRLNFYEMFGRFYAGDGREFAPLKVDYENILRRN